MPLRRSARSTRCSREPARWPEPHAGVSQRSRERSLFFPGAGRRCLASKTLVSRTEPLLSALTISASDRGIQALARSAGCEHYAALAGLALLSKSVPALRRVLHLPREG